MRSRQRLERNADKTIGITPMALDAEAKTLLAKKAANILAEKRRAATKERDENICLAFRYLSKDETLWGKDKSAAFTVLLKPEYKGWLTSGETPLRFLADVHGITRQGVRHIIKKGSN